MNPKPPTPANEYPPKYKNIKVQDWGRGDNMPEVDDSFAPTIPAIDMVLENLVPQINHSQSLQQTNIILAEAKAALNQFYAEEMLKIIGADEHLGEWDDENGVPEERTILENEAKNYLRDKLRQAIKDRWLGGSTDG